MSRELISIVTDATLTLPAVELCVLLVILAICLVVGTPRVGLITAYLFAYRWGFQVVMDYGQKVVTVYLVFGAIVGILTVVQMLRSRK
jgi:hypothetical protein